MAGNESMTYYRIPIWDVTLPSFASGQSYAYGTKGDIRRFMEERRRMLGSSSGDGLLDAYERWDGGENPDVNVAYQEVPFATAVTEIVSCSHLDEGGHDETYENTYGFPYHVHADAVSYDVLLIRQGCSILRLIKADVKGMSIGDGESMRHVSSYWGEPGILAVHDRGNLSSTMFLVESSYDDEDGERHAIGDGISLAPIMNQVVADG